MCTSNMGTDLEGGQVRMCGLEVFNDHSIVVWKRGYATLCGIEADALNCAVTV